jgi:translation initiation factor IF-2
MRIHELARQLGVKSKDILLMLEELGVGGKTASSSAPPVYLAPIRARFGEDTEAGAEAPAGAGPETAVEQPPKPAASEAPAPEATAPGSVAVEEEEGPANLIRVRAPLTITDFATALDTDSENVVKAATELGEEVSGTSEIAPELAVLIGEQWGYTVEVEVPELEAQEGVPAAEDVEPAEAPSPTAVEEPGPEPPVEPAPEEAAPPKRVVPRRIAPPDAPPRPPIVTVLGHVDHGKTTLLDAIRESNIVAQEPGEITQHIGAYQVEVRGRKITFIDTPGHEAFTAMRARGAQVTDIAVLVVAGDDGVMPQTLEAIDHAQAAGVPIIVAINKMDLPNASADAVKQRLTEKGLVAEEWGGDTIFVEVSALGKTGTQDLLEMIQLVAEMRELRALRDMPAEGAVLEAELDRRKGSEATLLVQEGVLRAGDSIVAGPVAGKVRAMTNDRGRRVKEAGPSTPVRVMGLSGVPDASEVFRVVESDREARALADAQRQVEREAGMRASAGTISMLEISQLFAEGKTRVLNLILKGDAQGTTEAVVDSLAHLVGRAEVSLNILHSGVGDITESDVGLAAATKPAVIVGFQVGVDAQARRLAADEHLEIRQYQVIYDVLADVRDTLSGMLEAVYEEVVVGQAEVRALFRSSRHGTIAGCYVLEGRVVRTAKARVRRAGEVVHEGPFLSMRHVKDDVSDVGQGFECGIVLEGFDEYEVGDVIEAIEEQEVRRVVL